MTFTQAESIAQRVICTISHPPQHYFIYTLPYAILVIITLHMFIPCISFGLLMCLLVLRPRVRPGPVGVSYTGGLVLYL